MKPWLIPVLVTMLVACAQEDPATPAPATYEEALERQSALVREITTVLQTVEDEAGAEQAAPRVEDLSRELQRLAVQMNAMPPLSWEEQDRLSRERSGSGTARKEAGRQMLKIEQYPVLQEAWKRGMQAGD
jgi:hypothetical protein